VAIDVPVAEIHDLVDGVDLIKLDVEGYEFEILNPIREYLIRERPTIFVEVLPPAKKLQRLIANLAQLGAYRIYALNTTLSAVDPLDIATGRLGDVHQTRDVLLLRASEELSVRDLLQRAREGSASWAGASRDGRP
jgi:hypothetical protein